MHPMELKLKHNLSYSLMAEWFAVEELAVRRWGFREGAKGKRNPPVVACRLAKAIDTLLLMGVNIEDIKF